MTTTDAVVTTYIAAWNEADPAQRRALIAEAFTEDTTYVDPLMAGAGHAEIDALIAGAQAQYPGHRFELTEAADAHNDRVRFSWTLVGPGGPVAVGRDFATVAADGRLRDVTGFLEAPVA
jgi:hypothetical protein